MKARQRHLGTVETRESLRNSHSSTDPKTGTDEKMSEQRITKRLFSYCYPRLPKLALPRRVSALTIRHLQRRTEFGTTRCFKRSDTNHWRVSPEILCSCGTALPSRQTHSKLKKQWQMEDQKSTTTVALEKQHEENSRSVHKHSQKSAPEKFFFLVDSVCCLRTMTRTQVVKSVKLAVCS